MSWYWKQKPKEGPDNIWESSSDYVLFELMGYHLERGASFEIGRPRSRGWTIFGTNKGVGGFENWINSMDIICVSYLELISFYDRLV